MQITKRSFEEFASHRARKGRPIGISWKADKVTALLAEEKSGTSGSEGGSAQVISLEEVAPSLPLHS